MDKKLSKGDKIATQLLKKRFGWQTKLI